jgi:glycosyltransferase involved in cell wall biosynthesis
MDVAIIAAARFPIAEPFAGGMEAHTHQLADALAERGHEVTVYAAGGAGRFRTRAMIAADFEPSPRSRLDVAAGPCDRLGEHHSYLDAMVDLATAGHDLVHINAVHHLPFACTSLLPARSTATLHSPPTPWLESAIGIAHRRRNPPRLASVSESNANAWRDVPIERVIPNGVDVERWCQGPGGDGAIWTGRVVPEKGPHVAIAACRTAGLALRIMGPIHDRAYFDELIAPQLGPDVEYVGHGTHAELIDAIGQASVAVVTPLWDEPFGLVVIEALACGTPVAALARGAMSELVDAEVGALATDLDQLPGAIGRAVTRDRGACRQRAMARHSAVRMVDAYETWFDEVIAS